MVHHTMCGFRLAGHLPALAESITRPFFNGLLKHGRLLQLTSLRNHHLNQAGRIRAQPSLRSRPTSWRSSAALSAEHEARSYSVTGS